jgi:hypothetical protein
LGDSDINAEPESRWKETKEETILADVYRYKEKAGAMTMRTAGEPVVKGGFEARGFAFLTSFLSASSRMNS